MRHGSIGHALVALCLLIISACTENVVAAPQLATDVDLDATKTRIEVGESLTIGAVARDARDSLVKDATISWSATPGEVATVSNGVVTGASPGTAIVHATVQSATASIAIDVVAAAAASLTVTAPSVTLAPGASVTAAVVIRDARQSGLSGRTVTWTSSDTRAVRVSAAGVATAVAPGTAYVVARSDGARDSVLLTVSGSATLTLEISPGDVALAVGRTRALSARTRDGSGALALPSSLTWQSDNAQIASVSDGVVTGIATGTTTIRAQSGALTATAAIRVGAGGEVFAVETATTGVAVIRADSIHISGVLTATAPLTLVSSGDIVISGSISAPCRSLTLLAGGRLIVTGSPFTQRFKLDNSCEASATPARAPGIRVEARGGYQFVSARVRSSGDIAITNDAGLLAADFVGAPIARDTEACVMNYAFLDHGEVATAAAGAPGRDGVRIDVACRGTLRTRDTDLNARGSSNGGSSVNGGSAAGGDGGRSGTIRFRVTGNLVVDEPRLHFRILAPGSGGDATATSSGTDGATALAIGGRGGDVGAPDQPPIEFRVAGDVIDNEPSSQHLIEMGIFISGRGGAATATAGPGRAAGATLPAGAGGAASAIGGRGGHVFPSLVTVGGVLPDGALVGLGQGAADGGSAVATGGRGGAGSAEFPNGAPGGAVFAEGGDGGVTDAANSTVGTAASGGYGGTASLSGGVGGAGFDRCAPAGAGGIGGSGGLLSGSDGRAGTGQVNGVARGITIAAAANGGVGGRGSTPGAGGRAGRDETQARGPRVVTPPSLLDGAMGSACSGSP